MDLSIFKGYDIRGIYPDQINEELAYSVGRAVVRMLSAKTVVVGRDMRTSSPSLAGAEIEEFKATHLPEDWGLDSQYVREQQVTKTKERIAIVQNLRLQSLADAHSRAIC